MIHLLKVEDLVYETNLMVLHQREKQIKLGYKSDGYQNYRLMVPIYKRRWTDPWTPEKELKYSTRCFNGIVRNWRKTLREFITSDTYVKVIFLGKCKELVGLERTSSLLSAEIN
jgi:hypothetical protein